MIPIILNTSNNDNLFLQKESLNQFLCDVNNNEKAIAQLYLNLTTKYFLTEFALQAVIDGMSFIFTLIQEHFIS